MFKEAGLDILGVTSFTAERATVGPGLGSGLVLSSLSHLSWTLKQVTLPLSLLLCTVTSLKEATELMGE